MDLIRTAVSRAKREAGATGVPAAGTPRGESPTRGLNGAPQGVRHITYTRTAVFQLDPQHLARNRIVAFDRSDPRSSQFDILRTQVLQVMEAGNLKSLGITSPTSGCGKTLTAVNLAISLSRQFHNTVLLVDFDLKSPTVASCLGIPQRTGLEKVFEGKGSIEDALINPGLDRLVILPCFRPVASSAELMMSDRVHGLVSELKGRYTDRIVIFDLPPLLQTDDTIGFLPQLDCSLLVVAEGQTTVEELAECGELLGSSANLGVVYNKSAASALRYPVYDYRN
jgi:Mrp family chromosome partitioning ATPase